MLGQLELGSECTSGTLFVEKRTVSGTFLCLEEKQNFVVSLSFLPVSGFKGNYHLCI